MIRMLLLLKFNKTAVIWERIQTVIKTLTLVCCCKQTIKFVLHTEVSKGFYKKILIEFDESKIKYLKKGSLRKNWPIELIYT